MNYDDPDFPLVPITESDLPINEMVNLLRQLLEDLRFASPGDGRIRGKYRRLVDRPSDCVGTHLSPFVQNELVACLNQTVGGLNDLQWGAVGDHVETLVNGGSEEQIKKAKTIVQDFVDHVTYDNWQEFTINDLAKRFDCSDTRIRKAIKTSEFEWLRKIKHGRYELNVDDPAIPKTLGN